MDEVQAEEVGKDEVQAEEVHRQAQGPQLFTLWS